VTQANGNSDIFTMNPDGSDQINVTNTPGLSDNGPAWAPNGTKIAFYTLRQPFPNYEVYVMNRDGGDQMNLTNPALDQEPAWSPDSSKIAFSSDRDGTCTDCNREIYVMNSDGTGTPLEAD
jgi:TolB protein